jgi:hypothetical protein
LKAYTTDVEARLNAFEILKVCGGERLVSRFGRFIYVKRDPLTSAGRLGYVIPGLSRGSEYTLSNRVRALLPVVLLADDFLTAVFVRFRTARRSYNLGRFEVLTASLWDVTPYAMSIGK